eukprot:GGOE01061142.1.p4 GENE.GGOE01061142.1~~GGOE01061142.1.p4  ORF type:complete len:100 (+),score=1.26 GGOE01061142.1:484-783(+)
MGMARVEHQMSFVPELQNPPSKLLPLPMKYKVLVPLLDPISVYFPPFFVVDLEGRMQDAFFPTHSASLWECFSLKQNFPPFFGLVEVSTLKEKSLNMTR